MRTKALLVILVLLLGTASLALAQERTLGGNVVELKDTTMIFRAEEGEGRIYTVDLAALPANVRESLENHREKVGLGQAIHLVAKPGPTADTLIASRATIDQPDRGWGAGKNRKFLKVVGTVESATGSLVTIKTPQGKVIPMEPSPRLTVARGQSVTVVYEEAPNEKRFLRWVTPPRLRRR